MKPFWYLSRLCLALAAAWSLPVHSADAQLSKGYQILLNRGFQLQGLTTKDNGFHFQPVPHAPDDGTLTGGYYDVGYNTVDWSFASTNNPNSNVPALGNAPGVPWARWVDTEADMPPAGNEAPYMSNLVGLSLADEQNLNDPTIRDAAVHWFNDATANPAYANTLLYTNSYGGQVSDATLGDFISRAHPDMLYFDTYPFKSQYVAGGTGNPADYAKLPVDNIPWESELRRYRQWSIGSGIPFGAYMQTFSSVQDYDQTVYRDPSPSELRFNNTVAVAFNAKSLTGFTYNSGASSLFINDHHGGGDKNRTALYAEQKLVNARLKNWSNTLVRLTPINDLHNPNDGNPPPGPASGNVNFPDGTTTGIQIIKGKNASGTPNALPIGFQSDPDSPNGYSWWEFQKNDPYLNGWGVTNTGNPTTGVKVNNGQPGDVIFSWFKPLDESFDGPNYNNEIYLIVVNALTDPNASAADCTQRINMNWLNIPDGDPNITGNQGILMLDPDTGQLTAPTLTSLGGGKFQLQLNLAGGDAVLFKFNDGAPFVGVPEPASLALLVFAVLPLRRRATRAPASFAFRG